MAIKVYYRKELKYDIDDDGKKEDVVLFILKGTAVFKLRRKPPKRLIKEWRKKHIKPGVTANIAIVTKEGERGGRTVLTSIWYDLDHLAEVGLETRRIIYEALKAIPEDKRSEEQKRALAKFKRMKLGGDNVSKITVPEKHDVSLGPTPPESPEVFERYTKLADYTKEFWHNILPVGAFYDPRYGKVKITYEMVRKMAENFKKGIPHYKPPINISHEDVHGKFGNIVEVEAREDGLWARIALTQDGTKLLEAKRFEYLSAEFTEHYINKETGEDVGPVLLGVALTNRPAHPKMNPIKLSELYNEIVEMVKRAFQAGMKMQLVAAEDEEAEVKLMIPKVVNTPKDDSLRWDWDWARDGNAILEKFGWEGLAKACAYVDKENYEVQEDGLPHNKQAYKLPHHKLINGKLTLVWGGVRAAMAALLGARGGVDIPVKDREKVYKHLAAHYKAFEKEPPKFHLSEDELQEVIKKMELEDKVVTLEDQIKKLEEEKKGLEEQVKKLSEEKAELEKKLAEAEKDAREKEVELWAKKWLSEGVVPTVVEKAKKVVLEQPEQMKVFDEMFEVLKKPELTKQVSESEVDDTKVLSEKVQAAVKMITGENK